MTQETITALPVNPTLLPVMTHFVLTEPGDPPLIQSLPPDVLAHRLTRIPLPPLLELAAAALSQIHRHLSLPDPVYEPPVASAIQRTLRPPAPLTVRCANLASLAHQRASTPTRRHSAGMSLLTVNILRETQYSSEELSDLTWNSLLDPNLPRTEPTAALIRELAPADTAVHPYPTAAKNMDCLLATIIANAGLGRSYNAQSGPAGILHDMATAGVLHPLESPQPTVEEGLHFINSLRLIPLI